MNSFKREEKTEDVCVFSVNYIYTQAGRQVGIRIHAYEMLFLTYALESFLKMKTKAVLSVSFY